WIIRVVSAFIPKRFRTEWRREWEAELLHQESAFANWNRPPWRPRVDLVRQSLGSACDAAWLQRRRLEEDFAQDVRHGFRLIGRAPGLPPPRRPPRPASGRGAAPATRHNG